MKIESTLDICYDPVAGRFTSEDSVWELKQKFSNGNEFDDPLSLNLYTYCHNDPVEFVDPSGHIVETVVDIASIGWSAYDMWNDPSWANAGYLAWDIAAALVPIAPGSYVVKAPKAVAKALSKADNAKKVSKSTVKMDLQLFADNGKKVGKWHRGSFDDSVKSLDYHFKKHGKELGAKDAEQYLRKAEEFARDLKGATKKQIGGSTSGVTRYYKNGKYIDLTTDKQIISFGKQ